jgi:hypothetical protein
MNSRGLCAANWIADTSAEYFWVKSHKSAASFRDGTGTVRGRGEMISLTGERMAQRPLPGRTQASP